MAEHTPDDLTPLILDSIEESVFTVDGEGRVTSFNRAAERLTGWSREEAIGARCHDVFRADICQTNCALRHTLQTGEALDRVRVTVLRRDMSEVPVTVSTAALKDGTGNVLGGVEIMRDITELESLRRELEGRHVFQDIVGRSAAMAELFRLLPDVARSDVPVLVEGPSGTGKELVAGALHRLSDRAERPFVRVNCGALPDTLLESELFGYRKGAFTDARRDYPGRFVSADGGTILLDEIGDTSPAFQVKLLRALQEGEVHPLGAATPISVDVRVVSATNKDLAEMVRRGAFREDLYYRLRVVALRLPPLSERREDIPLLADHLMRKIAAKRGRTARPFSPAAMAVLYEHVFPGNVRELENLIDRALVLCHGGEIGPEHLPPEVVAQAGRPRTVPTVSASASAGGGASVSPPPEHSNTDGDERAATLAALQAHRWNRRDAARALGVSRTTLWRRMRRLGLG